MSIISESKPKISVAQRATLWCELNEATYRMYRAGQVDLALKLVKKIAKRVKLTEEEVNLLTPFIVKPTRPRTYKENTQHILKQFQQANKLDTVKR